MASCVLELMQSDLNTQTIEEAVQNYKSRVERVANLQDVARCSEGSGVSAKIHYFARSPGSPFAYYYQMYDGAEKEWKPWAVMPMEVQTHEDQRLAELRAMTLLPVVMGGRLIVFTPQTVKRLSGVGVPDKEAIHKTQHNLEIKLGWSELQKNNKWTAKQVSPMSFRTPNSTGKTKVVMSVRNPGSGSVGIAVAAYTSQNGGGSLTGPKSTAFTFSNGSIEAHDGSKDRGNVHEFREAETVRAAIAAENVRNAVYDWEDGLHIPLLLMDKLASSHQYEKALEMAHRVFDPMCASGTDITAVWKWHPFKQKTTIPDQIQEILSHLKANTPAPKVDHWRDKPFRPHVVARERPVAYKRWVVVRYIEILIASGDRLFRQNTMESVPLAIQYYTLASHLYGPPGTTIPECRRNANPKTFRSLLSGWDAFSNALVQLETAFPFHRHTECSTQRTVSPVRTGPFFCVPRNTRLRDLRATIDDRLYKIRHCQDINGARLTRSLFEAPIDPGAMVRAAAQGLSVDNVLGHAGGPMPNYRFRYLLQTAFEMVQELKALGGEFLAAKEKKDAHAYELIRNGHGRIIQTMVMDMKKLSRDEAAKVLGELTPLLLLIDLPSNRFLRSRVPQEGPHRSVCTVEPLLAAHRRGHQAVRRLADILHQAARLQANRVRHPGSLVRRQAQALGGGEERDRLRRQSDHPPDQQQDHRRSSSGTAHDPPIQDRRPSVRDRHQYVRRHPNRRGRPARCRMRDGSRGRRS